jgi:hypothetical protein
LHGLQLDFTNEKCNNLSTTKMAKANFEIADLERWQKQGLITEEQLRAIVAVEGLEAKPVAGERKPGLNLITVIYYFGGFLALLSFTFYIGMNWEDLSAWVRFGVVFGAMLIVGAIGAWLRFMQKYHVAGGILLFVATAILPLSIYTLTSALGVWPEERDFYELRFAVLYLGLGSLAGALAALIATRFSLIALLVAGAFHITLLDIAQMIGGASFPAGESTAAIGGGLILLGILLTLWGKKLYSFWFKLYGLVALQISFTALYIESQSVLFGLLYLLVYLAMVAISLRFREAVFLVFGAIGFYIYIIRLVTDVFQETAYFPLVLGIIGLSIVLLAVLYQKYGQRLFRRRAGMP